MVGVPGAEAAVGFDLAGGLGVAEGGIVLHGDAEASGPEADALEFEFEWCFGGVFREDDEFGVRDDEFFDDDVAGNGFEGGLGAFTFGRDVDF